MNFWIDLIHAVRQVYLKCIFFYSFVSPKSISSRVRNWITMKLNMVVIKVRNEKTLFVFHSLGGVW